MKISRILGLGAILVGGAVLPASANIRITEYMYSGNGGEFVELTNVGASPIDMTGWSYSDSAQIPDQVPLSLFGVVQPGESVILTESNDIIFRTAWSLSGSVDVIGGNIVNLGRGDEINIYDAADALVDRLTYSDQTYVGTIRTQNASGWTTPNNLEDNVIDTDWVLSTVGDAQNSYLSLNGDIGNPGSYVPEPASIALLAIGAGVLIQRKR